LGVQGAGQNGGESNAKQIMEKNLQELTAAMEKLLKEELPAAFPIPSGEMNQELTIFRL